MDKNEKVNKKNEYMKLYRAKNKEMLKDYRKKNFMKYKKNADIYKKNWYQENKERLKEKRKKHYIDNKTKIIESQKQYAKKNKTKIKKRMELYMKNRRKNDINFKILDCLRSRINKFIKNKSKRSLELTGCNIDNLKKHLESKFLDGMSWDNYGKFGWHIDHIKPCALFDFTDISQQKECFHYTNLQPLWAKDNISKGKRYNL
jgi:hypothetical protein